MFLTLYRKWVLKRYFNKIKAKANNHTYFKDDYKLQFAKKVVPEIGITTFRLHRKLAKFRKDIFWGFGFDNLFLGQNWATIVSKLERYNKLISKPSFQIRQKKWILFWIRWKLFWAKKKVQPGETYRYL